MSINHEAKCAEFISVLEREGYSAKTLAEHRRCLDGLREYLSASNTPFSMEVALKWLECRKPSWSYDSYKRYRRALYRFGEYLSGGEICGETLHYRNNCFAYHDADVSYIKLSDDYKALYHEFYGFLVGVRAKSTVEHYMAGCADFLLYIAEQGYAAANEMTVECPLGYMGNPVFSIVLRGISPTVRLSFFNAASITFSFAASFAAPFGLFFAPSITALLTSFSDSLIFSRALRRFSTRLCKGGMSQKNDTRYIPKTTRPHILKTVSKRAF